MMLKIIPVALAAALAVVPGLATAQTPGADALRAVSDAALRAAQATGDVKPEAASDCTFVFASLSRIVQDPFVRVRVRGLDDGAASVEAIDRMHAWGLVTLREAKAAGLDATRLKGPFQIKTEAIYARSGGIVADHPYGMLEAVRKCDGMMFGRGENDFNVIYSTSYGNF